MVYHPLQLHPNTPQPVADFIQRHMDMQFHDVHCMLRLPIHEQELRAGCNFAAATWLLNLVGGISTILYKQEGVSGDLFKGVLEFYYPWDHEPPGETSVTAKEGAALLYELFRNPLAHSLGVSTERIRSGRDPVIRLRRRNKLLDLNMGIFAYPPEKVSFRTQPHKPQYLR